MSRSEYVWVVVTGPNRGVPVAAFTVKHELVKWLSSRQEFTLKVVKFTHMDMLRDIPPVWLDRHTLKPLGDPEVAP